MDVLQVGTLCVDYTSLEVVEFHSGGCHVGGEMQVKLVFHRIWIEEVGAHDKICLINANALVVKYEHEQPSLKYVRLESPTMYAYSASVKKGHAANFDETGRMVEVVFVNRVEVAVKFDDVADVFWPQKVKRLCRKIDVAVLVPLQVDPAPFKISIIDRLKPTSQQIALYVKLVHSNVSGLVAGIPQHPHDKRPLLAKADHPRCSRWRVHNGTGDHIFNLLDVVGVPDVEERVKDESFERFGIDIQAEGIVVVRPPVFLP